MKKHKITTWEIKNKIGVTIPTIDHTAPYGNTQFVVFAHTCFHYRTRITIQTDLQVIFSNDNVIKRIRYDNIHDIIYDLQALIAFATLGGTVYPVSLLRGKYDAVHSNCGNEITGIFRERAMESW